MTRGRSARCERGHVVDAGNACTACQDAIEDARALVDLEPAAFDRMLDILERPPAPSAPLRAIMRSPRSVAATCAACRGRWGECDCAARLVPAGADNLMRFAVLFGLLDRSSGHADPKSAAHRAAQMLGCERRSKP